MKRVLRKYRRQKRSKISNSPDLLLFKPQAIRTVPQRANLEGVAVEVQQAILHHIPDFSTLQALISASPIYYRSFLSQMDSILSDILLRDIHPDVLFDALAIKDAQKLPRNYDDYVPGLKGFIEQYKTTRASRGIDIQPLEPSVEEILWPFHQSVLDVTKDFCDYTLSTHPVTGVALDSSTSLSPMEVIRIHRALYRYELFAVLFCETDLYHEEQAERHRHRDPGRARLALQRNSIRSLDSQDKSFLFLALFNAWEVEEIACVRDYIMHRYDELFVECELDIDNVDDSILSKKPYHQHYLSLGLGFFQTVLRASREDKLRMLQDNLGYSFSSLSRALEEAGPEWESPMYDAYRKRATIVFDGDVRTDCPNAAWIWSTKNKVEIRYDQYEKKGMRKWGYVMWDRERLDQWNIFQEKPSEHFLKRDTPYTLGRERDTDSD